MALLCPGQTPCPSPKEFPGTVGWNQWRQGAPWTCPQMLCCRYLLSYTMQWDYLILKFHCNCHNHFHMTVKCNNFIRALSLWRYPTWATLPACRAQDPRHSDTWGLRSVVTATGKVSLRQSWSLHKHIWRTMLKMKMQRRMSLWSVWLFMFTHQITSKVATEFIKLTVNTKNKSRKVFWLKQ